MISYFYISILFCILSNPLNVHGYYCDTGLCETPDKYCCGHNECCTMVWSMWYFWFAFSIGVVILCFLIWKYYRIYYDDSHGENFVWSFGPYSKTLSNFNLNPNKNKLNRYQRVKQADSKSTAERFFPNRFNQQANSEAILNMSPKSVKTFSMLNNGSDSSS